MLKPNVIQTLSALPKPVLTVYLDTDRAKQINRGLKPSYLIQLESQAKSVAQAVSPDEQELFRRALMRIGEHLESQPPRCRGVVIFAGKATWECVPLQVEVETEIHWGTPALAQLLWLLDEHKRYGIVVPGRKRTRFFLYWLGEVSEFEEKEFRLEPSKKKEMGPVARPGVHISRGTNRDVFEHHVNAEYSHYDQQIAERIGRWVAAEQLESVFLVGLSQMVKAIRKEFSQTLIEKIVLIEEDLDWVSRTALLDRIRPVVVNHKRASEMAVVETMLVAARHVVLGIDETLVQLQQGKIRSVVVEKRLNGTLQQCLSCFWADRSSGSVCPICGGNRENVALRDVLPELVRRQNASLQIVSCEAADKLRENGGMGAWLREFEKKEYRASA